MRLLRSHFVHEELHTGDRERWLYALGNLGCAIPYQALGAVLLFFYTDVRRLNPTWAAAVMSAYAIYNALNNPLMGYLSDRTHSRWGRRIPYLLFGALPYALLFVTLFLAPFDGVAQPLPLLIYFAVALLLFETAATVVQTAYYALLPEMFSDYQERTAVAVRMNLFMTVGLLIGAALPTLLAGLLGWGGMALLFGGVTAGALYLGLAGMGERARSVAAPGIPWPLALRATLSNRSFVTLVAAQTMRHFATATLAAGMVFYTKYSLGVEPGQSSLILGTAFVVAGLALVPWRQWVANRLPARTTLMLAYGLLGGTVLLLGVVHSLVGALVAAALVGVALAGLILMGDVVLSDVIDEDAMRTGQRREGMYFGMSGMIIMLAYALSSVVFGWVAGRYGYDPALSSQPATVAAGFRFYMTIPPALGSGLAVLSLWFYPLHGTRLAEVKEWLARQLPAPQAEQ